jgi:hypothetical protein
VEQNLFFYQIEAEEIALGELSHISAKKQLLLILMGRNKFKRALKKLRIIKKTMPVNIFFS